MGLCFDFGAVLEGHPNVLFAVDGDVVRHRQSVCFQELCQRLPAPQVLQVCFDLMLSSYALGSDFTLRLALHDKLADASAVTLSCSEFPNN